MLKVTLPLSVCCTLFAVVLQAQTINNYIPSNTPDSRYILHSDGTATDTVTGLLWQRCSLGQTWNGSTCTGSISTYTWQLALQQGANNNFAGYSDWRLPNKYELGSIVASERRGPAINTTVFPNTPIAYYWSSSPGLINSDSVSWYINFDGGFDATSIRSGTFGVRLVRDHVPLDAALDNSQLTWTTSGSGNWIGQTAISYDSKDSAQSGKITHNQETVLQTTLTGPGTLTFQWKVSSESCCDFLRFYIDSNQQASKSGDVGWEAQSFSIPSGSHTVQWKYTKDGSINTSQDAGWVDRIEWSGN